MRKLIATAVAAIALLGARPAYAQATVPAQPAGWVADAGNMFSPEDRASMEREVAAFRTQQNVQIVVLTLGDTNGEDPKSICVRTLNGWNPGPRCVMVFASVTPRKLFIQPGTDLKYIFTEAVSSGICRNTMAPSMKQGNRGAAFLAGIQAVESAFTSAQANGTQTYTTSASYTSLPWYQRWTAMDWFWAVVIVVVCLIILYALLAAPRRRYYGGGYGGGYTEVNFWGGSGGSSSSSSSSSYSGSSDYSSGGGSSYDSGGSVSCDGGRGGGGDY
jgi:uncharacterized membrane protein YgcG